MESLERNLNNISLEDSAWRQHDQTQPVWGNNAAQNRGVWGHVPVQFQQRSPWQHENPEMPSEQSVNDALGISSGNSAQWGPSNGPNEYEKQIWADPSSDVQYPPPPQHGNFGGGLGGPEWGMNMPNQHQGPQPMWADGGMGKDSDQFWKQQHPQAPPGQFGMPVQGGWQPRQMNHPNGPPGHVQRGGHMMPQQDFQQGGWVPNGMRPNKMGWGGDQQQRMGGGMAPRNGGRSQQQQGGRFQGGMQGVDVSVPPPMDMPHMGMGMRPMGQQGHAPWKQQNQGGQVPNNNRHSYQQRGGMNHNSGGGGGAAQQGNMWNGGSGGSTQNLNESPFTNYNNFPIGGAQDDLTLSVWHDPNGELKKWQRDTGVSHWGDPDKQTDRSITMWLIAEGQEEDLEAALNRCPVPQKKVGKGDESSRFPFPIPQKRPIIVTGWGELPENDPNNPTKSDVSDSALFDDNARWTELTTEQNPWYLPNQHGNTFINDSTTTSWVQGGTIPLEPGQNNPQNQLAEMLKYAVEKGYLDVSVTMSQNLPPLVLQNVNALLSKIPALESVETELKTLIDSVNTSPEEVDHQNPERFMNEVQKVEHNRLIIAVTTAKIEVQDLSKKIQRALIEAGIMQQPQERNVPSTSEDYHYSFLE